MIDYNILSDAIAHYEDCGYKYIEVPWFVDYRAIHATKPPECRAIEGRGWSMSWGYLVGSAEQSFIQKMIDNELAPGAYVACTPCFRDEKCCDEHRKLHFMKVELIKVCELSDIFEVEKFRIRDVYATVMDAMRFMSQYADVSVVKTAEGFDIVDAYGLELGSYGLREFDNYQWVYGTGAAEPRLSTASISHAADKSIELVKKIQSTWPADFVIGQ